MVVFYYAGGEMAKQNIFDNETFFEGYKQIRKNDGNANDVFEIPALLSLLPDMKGKKVLDLGCGFGEHCVAYIRMGAERLVGLDISEKMLEVARKENSDPKITYINMPMEDLGMLSDKLGEDTEGMFDVVISSLAFHYIEDFEGVLKNIYSMLSTGGVFVFSQEHPLNTSHSGGDRWTRDDDGNKLFLNLKDYAVEGERESVWFVDDVKIYHRMFSTIINNLIDAGFVIEKMIEPIPDEEILKKYPSHADLRHKPDFMLIRGRKNV
jgi:2-polyprenyl-3-methyl-5-hydroxy-6-metoxy-1,4-benzoquinol methylase